MSSLGQRLIRDRRLRAALTVLMWGAVLFLLGRVAQQAWHSLEGYSLHLGAVPLLLSAIVLVAAFLNGAYGWHLLLGTVGAQGSARKDAADWLLAQAAKYLPAGTVWYFGGRFVQGRRSGLDSATVSVALALEFAFYLVGALVLAGLSLWLWPGMAWGWQVSAVTVVMVVLGWLLAPRAMQGFGRWVGGQSGIGAVVQHVQGRRLRWLALFYLWQWALIGLAFWLLVRSVYPVGVQEVLPVGGAFSLSAALGYLAVLIPGGWGVREGALAVLLGRFMPLGAMVAILARLWYTVVEGMCILLGWLMQRGEPFFTRKYY